MPNANKNKGKSFERELAHHLTTVFGFNFERVWSSGAFTGGKNVSRLQKLSPAQQLATVGDIIPPEQLSKFSWECKFYKTIPFHTFLEENALLDKWIEQAKCPDRYWFLVFKINNQGAFVVFDPNHPFHVRIAFAGNYIYYKGNTIVKMENFFERNKAEMLGWNALMNKPVQEIIKEAMIPKPMEWTMPIDGEKRELPAKLVTFDGESTPRLVVEEGLPDGIKS